MLPGFRRKAPFKKAHFIPRQPQFVARPLSGRAGMAIMRFPRNQRHTHMKDRLDWAPLIGVIIAIAAMISLVVA